MKCYDVSGSEVTAGIPVVTGKPYPRVILGAGGHKRATWIALGHRDAAAITKMTMKECPDRGAEAYRQVLVGENFPDPPVCNSCGQKFSPWKQYGDNALYESVHPDAGLVADRVAVFDTGAIKLPARDGKPEAFLIVAPRPGGGNDNRAMVLWRVASGYRGGASITAGPGIVVIGSDVSWASGRGSLGETAEMLAILAPGQELRASRSGRRVQNTTGRLTWDGKEIHVSFGGEELEAATASEVQGEYL